MTQTSPTILDPLAPSDIPRLEGKTPATLRDEQRTRLRKLTLAATELRTAVDSLDPGLSDTARSQRATALRQRFNDDEKGRLEELRQAGQTAEALLKAHFTNDAIRTRATLTDAATPGRAWWIGRLTPIDAYQVSLEAIRTSNLALAAQLLAEIRVQLSAGLIDAADAAAVMDLCEAVPLPPAELAAREALQEVVLDALEATDTYMNASTGRAPGPEDRLMAERRRQAVQGIPEREPDPATDPGRMSSARRRAAGLS